MNKQEVTVTELLAQIYHRIHLVVRSATIEAVEQVFKNKSLNVSAIDDENLSAPQAALYLKIKVNTLYKMIANGEINFSRSGKRKLLFLKSDLEQHIANRKVKGKNVVNNEIEIHLIKK